MKELESVRKIIDKTDKQMAELFKARMEAVRAVAEYKAQRGLPVTDKTREEAILKRNAEWIENDEIRSYYVRFLENNMALSRDFQHKLLEGTKVAYSGVEGAFANIATKRIFPDAKAVAYPDFKAAYKSVVDGECDCAVLPIENSYNGDVNQVIDLSFFGSLSVNGIYNISVVQNLLAVEGATIDDIKEVISHPQALGQCAEYIKKHNFREIQAVNTAVAVKQVAEWGRRDVAAIGSEEAAEKYGLKKIDSHINSSQNNTTKFAVFSRVQKKTEQSDNHFLMLFTVKNEAGSLGKAVSVIGNHGFNLKAIKSRPARELIWSYYFYVEGEGNIASKQGEAMLEDLKNCCDNVRILGSFEKEFTL